MFVCPGKNINVIFIVVCIIVIQLSGIKTLGKDDNISFQKNSKNFSSFIRIIIKGAVGSADLKISKSALLSLNHHNFSNTKPIYTE